jgi:hypothetical protein
MVTPLLALAKSITLQYPRRKNNPRQPPDTPTSRLAAIQRDETARHPSGHASHAVPMSLLAAELNRNHTAQKCDHEKGEHHHHHSGRAATAGCRPSHPDASRSSCDPLDVDEFHSSRPTEITLQSNYKDQRFNSNSSAE